MNPKTTTCCFVLLLSRRMVPFLIFFISAGLASAQTSDVIRSFGNITNAVARNPNGLVSAPDGTLYGVANGGEDFILGTLFRINPDGSGFAILKSFTNELEGVPLGKPVLGGTLLYGRTLSDGPATVFRINVDGSGYTILRNFVGNFDFDPGRLLLEGDTLYGTAADGQRNIFKMSTNGSGYALVRSFSQAEGFPSDMVIAAGVLYGTTGDGGPSGEGTVFRMNLDGTGFTVLKDFNGPDGSLANQLLADGAILYGSTLYGGSAGGGNIFSLQTDGGGFTNLANFDQLHGRIVLADGYLYGAIHDVHDSNILFRLRTNGSQYTVLRQLPKTSDDIEYSPATVWGTNVYGIMQNFEGGYSAFGSIWKMGLNGGDFAEIKAFPPGGGDGAFPGENLILTNGVIYGTTDGGGLFGRGTVFKMNRDGSGYAILIHLSIPGPTVRLQGLAGSTLYGTIGKEDSLDTKPFVGFLFRIGTNGNNFNVVRFFDGTNAPIGNRLVLYNDSFYGRRSSSSGFGAAGTIFKINTNGLGYAALKTFSFFTPDDGLSPFANLIVANGVIYGSTVNGGAGNGGVIFAMNTDGSAYRVLQHFTNNLGYAPYGDMILSGPTLYGTTRYGGGTFSGTVFRIDTNGMGFVSLKSFASQDGSDPIAPLVLFGDILYGNTSTGGAGGKGQSFRLDIDGADYHLTPRMTLSSSRAGRIFYAATKTGGTLGIGTVSAVSLQPELQVLRNGSNLMLSWRTNLGFFQLQTVSTLAATPWATISNASSILGREYRSTISPSNAAFYRLVDP